MTEDEFLIEQVHAALAKCDAPTALRVLDAVRADFLEWGSETGTLGGGEQ